jgi:hypothetical protein
MGKILMEKEEDLFIWEEYEHENNKLYYEYDLEDLENQPKKENKNVHKTPRNVRNIQS